MAWGQPAAAPQPTGGHNPNKSFEVPQPPADGVSSLSFSPAADLLCATSWDNTVRIWEVQNTGQSVGKAQITHDQPVLCAAWSGDGAAVFTAGACKTAKMWTLATNQQQQVAQHDAPIRQIAWIEEMKLLATGSWDKTLRYWDLRSPAAVHTQQLPERCYAMDVRHPLMTVCTADRSIVVFNMQNPQQEYKRIPSPLKFQTRCVATFPDKTGFLVGSVEGRVAVHHVEDAMQQKNFTFKCHRHDAEIYAVNSIAFHPVYGTFATAGADGAFNFWDKDSKQRLKAMPRCDQPIPSGCFNRDGRIYAHAVSYDWSRGAEGHTPGKGSHILLHACQEAEVRNRQAKKK